MAMYDKLVRSVPVLDVSFEQNELEAIFVPWNRPARVFDPDEPEPYEEGFRPGAFDPQLLDPRFRPAEVPLLPRHGSSETFGHARKLDSTDVGLHGVVAIRPSLRDDVAQMVDDGIDSMSIEFFALQRGPRITDTGVRWRDRAVLVAVAMTSKPAYDDAKVLALREQHDLESLDRAARIRTLEAEIEELRAGGDRWRSAAS